MFREGTSFVSKFVAVVFLMTLFSLTMMAQSTPTTMNYQGRLTDNTPGQTPVDATISITFTIHDHITNVSPVWTESWPAVAVNDGIFSVLLGSNGTALPDSVFSSTTTLYLELDVAGETLAPRQTLGSVGFAHVSVTADTALDLNCTNCVDGGAVNFNYAASSSEAGPATDVTCTDCVDDGDVSDNISIDNGRLFAPSGTGSVGIGTNIPNAKLEVVGTLRGVLGSGTDYGLSGIAQGTGTRYGVLGDASGSTGDSYGVYGRNALVGVYGSGSEVGVLGQASGSGDRAGLVGNGNGTAGNSYGVQAFNADYGVYGNGQLRGLWGLASGTGTRYGVYGDGNGTTGTSYGLFGTNADIGVYASGNTQAALFSGEVYVSRNSTSTQPHIELYETGSGDYARIKFRQAGSSASFDIAGSPNNTGSSGWLNFFSSEFGDVLRLRGDGFVYLNRFSSGSTTMCTSASGAGYLSRCSSSGRYKENITSLGLGLDTVMSLHPVLFNWIEDGLKDVGFVAEEVSEVNSVLITKNEEGTPEGVRYRQLTAVLAKAIQEQQAIIESQQTQLETLTERLAVLESKEN